MVAEGRLGDARAEAALAHTARCPDCRGEAERLALLVHHLRRLGATAAVAAAADPDPERSWAALRGRILRGRTGIRERVLRARADLAGLVLSALVVAMAVAPNALHVPLAGGVGEPVGGNADQWDRQAWLLEASYATSRRAATPTDEAVSTNTDSPGWVTIPRTQPDRLLPIRKEVEPGRTAGQPAASPARIAGPS